MRTIVILLYAAVTLFHQETIATPEESLQRFLEEDARIACHYIANPDTYFEVEARRARLLENTQTELAEKGYLLLWNRNFGLDREHLDETSLANGISELDLYKNPLTKYIYDGDNGFFSGIQFILSRQLILDCPLGTNIICGSTLSNINRDKLLSTTLLDDTKKTHIAPLFPKGSAPHTQVLSVRAPHDGENMITFQ